MGTEFSGVDVGVATIASPRADADVRRRATVHPLTVHGPPSLSLLEESVLSTGQGTQRSDLSTCTPTPSFRSVEHRDGAMDNSNSRSRQLSNETTTPTRIPRRTLTQRF